MKALRVTEKVREGEGEERGGELWPDPRALSRDRSVAFLSPLLASFLTPVSANGTRTFQTQMLGLDCELRAGRGR